MGQKLILLAEDDRDDKEMFCEALEEINNGISYQCAINGEQLLNKLDALNESPDLIFLDVNMPIMNGWECLKNLKEHEQYRDIPVIMISTSSHLQEIDNAISMGAICYFVKPSDFNELIKVLKAITSNIGPNLKDVIADLQIKGNKYVFNSKL